MINATIGDTTHCAMIYSLARSYRALSPPASSLCLVPGRSMENVWKCALHQTPQSVSHLR